MLVSLSMKKVEADLLTIGLLCGGMAMGGLSLMVMGHSESEYEKAVAAYSSGSDAQGNILEADGQWYSELSSKILIIGVGLATSGAAVGTRRPLSGESQ
jgi:hypothetical protein